MKKNHMYKEMSSLADCHADLLQLQSVNGDGGDSLLVLTLVVSSS